MNEPNLNERIKSAATPKTAGAIEEREAIAEYAEKRAQYYDAKLEAVEAELARADYDARADTYRRLAREIRDGAHHEE